ncbi:hypothetical protein HY041_02410 [Candidatus Roizmanbacteria bacterium]|nr:hypothetical protein [Candidatus Roizmanbacteria bacterium]
MKYFKKLFTNWVLVSFLLFFLGIVLTLINISLTQPGFTVLNYVQYPRLVKNTPGEEILAHQKAVGLIQAQENYFGSIQLRMNALKQLKYDEIIFRIKEKGSTEWYYQNRYTTIQMAFLPFFPFGFPPIEESKDKIYEFEIESIRGTYDNAISISDFTPSIISRSQFPKNILLANKKELLHFIQIKIKNVIENIDPITDVFIFFLPFFYYLVWIFSRKRYPSLTIILFIVILYDIFFIKSQRDIVFLSIGGLWIIHSFVSKFTSKVSLLVAFFLISICFLLALFQIELFIEKPAVWAYVFLIAMIFVKILESKISNKYKSISVDVFLKTLFHSTLLQLPLYGLMLLAWGIINIIHVLINFISLLKDTGLSILNKFLFILEKLRFELIHLNPKTGLNLFFALSKIVVFVFFSILSALAIIAVIIGLIIFSIQSYIKLDQKIRTENLRRLRLSLDPVILFIEPGIVYQSTKIIMYGNGFDPKSDKSSVLKLLAPKHQIEDTSIDYLNNSKIIFTIPLHWNTGQLYFWVETPIIWEGKLVFAKSNVVSVKLIPRITPYSPGFSPDDDAYFKQLKDLHEETLRLNGHL